MENPRATCMVVLSVLLGAWAVFSCPGSSGGGGGSADTGIGSDAASGDAVSDTTTGSDATTSDTSFDTTGGGSDIDRLLAYGSGCSDDDNRGSISVLFTFIDSFVSLSGISVSTEYVVWNSMIDCMLAAVDCDELRACLVATEAQDALCDSRAFGDSFCDGDTVIECGWEEGDDTEIIDCVAAGLICGEDTAEANAGCGVQTCDSDTDADYCDGTAMMRCEDGVFVVQDCLDRVTLHCSDGEDDEMICTESYGGRCVTDGADGVGCEGTGPECVLDTFENSCDGTVLTSCRSGYEAEFDCTRVGSNRTCGMEEDGHNGCMFATDECDYLTPEACSDGVITYCGNGQVRQLSCGSFGFSGCDTANADEHVIAFCVL